MLRLSVALLLMTIACGRACAQRHGRPDAVQNYMASHRPSNPILAIRYQAAKRWTYFHLSTLLTMNRSTVEVVDSKTKQKRVYDGVSLRELVASSTVYHLEVFREFWAFRDKQVALDPSLNTQANVIVADTLNGKRLGINNPFRLIVTNDQGDVVIVKNLAYIRLAGSP